MKLKYYLRGIGVGVVITTILFMIIIPLHKNDAKSQDAAKQNTESKTVADLKKSLPRPGRSRKKSRIQKNRIPKIRTLPIRLKRTRRRKTPNRMKQKLQSRKQNRKRNRRRRSASKSAAESFRMISAISWKRPD